MYSAIALTVLTLSTLGTGVRSQGSSRRMVTPHTVPVPGPATASLFSSFVATKPFTITTARWVTYAPANAAGIQSLQLQVDGVTQCTVTVGCLSVAGTKTNAVCNVQVLPGQEVEWVRSGCAGDFAAGSITYLMRQR